MAIQDRGKRFSVTATGTSTAFATQAGATNVIYFVTDISGSTVSAGTISVLGGATGTTVLWADIITGSGSSYGYIKTFSEPLSGFPGGLVQVQLGGTITAYANISGFSINAS